MKAESFNVPDYELIRPIGDGGFGAVWLARNVMRYGRPLHNKAQVTRFRNLLGGQPYLARLGLHELATKSVSSTAFEALADREEGIFGDHLRQLCCSIKRDSHLVDVVKRVLSGEPYSSPEDFYRLRSAGVLLGNSGQEARPRCQLYPDYLKHNLGRSLMPE
jgi:hypothetical protein